MPFPSWELLPTLQNSYSKVLLSIRTSPALLGKAVVFTLSFYSVWFQYYSSTYRITINQSIFVTIFLRKLCLSALAGMAQWIERWPANQRVTSWFPVGAHTWVAGQVPCRGHVRGNHTLMFPSLSPSFSLCWKIHLKNLLNKRSMSGIHAIHINVVVLPYQVNFNT